VDRGALPPAELTVREQVRLFERECNAPDLDGYAALFAPDVEAATGARTTRGRDAAVGTFSVLKGAFPDLVVTFAHVLVSGDEVATEIVERGTHTGPLVLPGRTVHP